jgi:hypothetical protein
MVSSHSSVAMVPLEGIYEALQPKSYAYGASRYSGKHGLVSLCGLIGIGWANETRYMVTGMPPNEAFEPSKCQDMTSLGSFKSTESLHCYGMNVVSIVMTWVNG